MILLTELFITGEGSIVIETKFLIKNSLEDLHFYYFVLGGGGGSLITCHEYTYNSCFMINLGEICFKHLAKEDVFENIYKLP